jgi:hypothetical protein
MSKEITQNQLNNLCLWGHGDGGVLITMNYILTSNVLREVLEGYKPTDENGDIKPRVSNPWDRAQINSLGGLMNLLRNDGLGNIIFSFCRSAKKYWILL